MKNLKAISLLVLAVILGLVAAIYAAGWISQRGNISANKVVVAAVDIQLGSRITEQMLSTVDWPSASTPAGTFGDFKQLQDRVAKVSVLRGEPILDAKLAPIGTRGGLSAVIAEGKRAMTVRVNDVVGVAGFALPGNYVDVMVNTQQDKEAQQNDKQISKTVLKNVLVLAVAQESGRDDTKPKVVSAVTLELTPEESEKLDLARSVGTLSLVLRNQIDNKSIVTVGATKKDLLGETSKPDPAPAAAPRTVKVQVKPAAVVASDCVEVIQSGARGIACFAR